MQETRGRSLGLDDPLEKEMATHSNILAWRIPGQRSLAGYSPWDRKQSNTTERQTQVLRRKEALGEGGKTEGRTLKVKCRLKGLNPKVSNLVQHKCH